MSNSDQILRERIKKLEKQLAAAQASVDRSRRIRASAGTIAGKIAWRVFAGWRLDAALAAVFQSIERGESASTDEYAFLAGAIIRRMLYVSVFVFMLALLPAIVAILQTHILSKQNEILIADHRERTLYGQLDSLASASGLLKRIDRRLKNFTAFHEVRGDPAGLVCQAQFSEARAWSFTLEQNSGLLVFYRDIFDDMWNAINILRHLYEHTCNAENSDLDKHIFSEVHRGWDTLLSAEASIEVHLDSAKQGLPVNIEQLDGR